jgi:hypothetical protein
MSELSRWKEYRIRQAIYLENLRQQPTPLFQADCSGSDLELKRASSEVLLQSARVGPVNRRALSRMKNERLPCVVLRFGLLAGSVAIWLLLWWVEFGIHR